MQYKNDQLPPMSAEYKKVNEKFLASVTKLNVTLMLITFFIKYT